MNRLLYVALLGACASSSYGEAAPDSSMDAGSDGGTDAAVEGDAWDGRDELCRSQLLLPGCAYNDDRWLWDGSECVPLFECADRGYATDTECRRAHVACGAEPPMCAPIACPFECGVTCDDEGQSECDCAAPYVLYRHELRCSEGGERVWVFGLALREDVINVRDGVGELRDPVGVPALSIDVQLPVGDADPFHEPWRIDVTDPRIRVERCNFEGCESPREGFFQIETGGAGEARVLLRFQFAEDEVLLGPGWLSIEDARRDC